VEPSNWVHTSFGEAQKYEALSYVWGDASLRAPITVNGKELLITTNFHAYLNRLCHIYELRTIWVDTICIDQSNPDERSAQVQLMAQIYQQATRLLIWLGEEGEYTDIAFTAIRKIALRPVLTGRSKGNGVDRHAAFKDIHHTFSSLARMFGLVNFKLWDLSKEGITAIESTFRFRSWWTRVFVIQEIVVAKAATVICGSITIAWDTMQISSQCDSEIAILEAKGRNNLFGHEMWRVVKVSPVIRNFGLLMAGRHNTRFMLVNLREVLSLSEHRNCSDPRDVIHGILSLARSPATAIIPDYRKSISVVYTEMTRVLVEESRNWIFSASGTVIVRRNDHTSG
jgi:hypothetical protein